MKDWLRAYPYMVTGVICSLAGIALGVFGVRVADRAPVDWPATATAIKDAVTAIGILGAGAWAAYLAARRRSLSTRAQLVHRYVRWKRGSDEFLRVYIQLRNIGDTQINPGYGWTYVQTPPKDVLLKSPAEDSWVDAVRVMHPMQDEEVYLEPGETEDYNFDFPIPLGSRILQLHTYVECDRRRDDEAVDVNAALGSTTPESRPDETLYNHWSLTTLIDLELKGAGGARTPALPSLSGLFSTPGSGKMVRRRTP